MNDYQIRFLAQSVLGQKVNINNSDDVIRKCVELADRDMMSGGRFACKHFKKKNKDDRVKYILEELEKNSFEYCKIDKKRFVKYSFGRTT